MYGNSKLAINQTTMRDDVQESQENPPSEDQTIDDANEGEQ